jgi:hypothetical protein
MDKYWSSQLPLACKEVGEVRRQWRVGLHGDKFKPRDRPFILASESAKEECLHGIHDEPALPQAYDSVVIAFAPAQFNYVALNTAFRVLMGEHHTQRGQPRPDYPLIATHRARYVGDSDGALSLGPGPFVAALENATGKTAEIVGKPERKFFELVLNSFGSDVQDRDGIVAVIGDDIQNDLGDGAVELGFWRVLGTRISSFLLVMTMTGINGIQSGQESTGTEMRQGQALDRLTKFVILSPRSSRAYWTNKSSLCNTRQAVGVSFVNKLESDEWETCRFMSTGRTLPFHIRPFHTLRKPAPRQSGGQFYRRHHSPRWHLIHPFCAKEAP